MKTAISVPDDTFARASQRANELGVSRSEFFARAAQSYLDELDMRSLAGRIDDAIERLGPTDGSTDDALAAGRRLLATADDTW